MAYRIIVTDEDDEEKFNFRETSKDAVIDRLVWILEVVRFDLEVRVDRS